MNISAYKSTLLGIIGFAAVFIVTNPEDVKQWPILLHLAQFVLAGGVLAKGLSSSDEHINNAIGSLADAIAPRPVPSVVPTGNTKPTEEGK